MLDSSKPSPVQSPIWMSFEKVSVAVHFIGYKIVTFSWYK
jgi:hypothetical protein